MCDFETSCAEVTNKPKRKQPILTTAALAIGEVDSVDVKRTAEVHRPPRTIVVESTSTPFDICVHLAVVSSVSAVTATATVTVNAALPRRSLQCHVHASHSFHFTQAYIRYVKRTQNDLRSALLLLHVLDSSTTKS